MGKKNKEPRDMSIDMSGFSDDQLRNMYNQSTAGVRRQGYDSSNDTTVDYTPSAEDAIYASSAVSSDWEGGDWDQLRDSITSGHSEEDLINKMRGAVNSEYTSRRDKKLADMQAGIDANTNREFEAPAVEQKEEEEVVESDKLSSARERVKAYEDNMRKPGEGSKYGVFGQDQTSTEQEPVQTEVEPEEPQQTPSTKYELDVDEESQSVANDYLDKYKSDLIQGNKFSK